MAQGRASMTRKPEGETSSLWLSIGGMLMTFGLFLAFIGYIARNNMAPKTAPERPSIDIACEKIGLRAVRTSRIDFCVTTEGQMIRPEGVR